MKKIKKVKKAKAKKSDLRIKAFDADTGKTEIEGLDFDQVVSISEIYESPGIVLISMTNGDGFFVAKSYEYLLNAWVESCESFNCDTAVDISNEVYRGVANCLLLNKESFH